MPLRPRFRLSYLIAAAIACVPGYLLATPNRLVQVVPSSSTMQESAELKEVVGTDGQMCQFNSTGPTATTMSGDATISDTGAMTLATVTVPKGGTGNTTLTAHGFVLGEGTSSTAALSPAQGAIVIGQGGSADPVASTFVGISHQVRGIVIVSETIGSFDGVSGGTARDGVTYAAGDRVLLVGQATKSQNGVYVVGTVSTGTAPLTRPTDFATGQVVPSGTVIEASEGTLFANTTWKITTTGGVTVDTTNFDVYPRVVTQQVTLSSSTVNITNVPILSATTSNFFCTLAATGGTTTSTIGYGPIAAATAGSATGSPSVTIVAIASGGSKNGTSDASHVNCSIQNF